MIIYHIIWIFTTFLLVGLQISWPEILKIGNASPNLPLIGIIYIALTYGEERAMVASILAGLYLDVASNTTLGFHILCFVVPAFAFGKISARLISLHPAVKATLIFFASLLYGVIFNTVSYLQDPFTNFFYTLIADTIPQSFYTAILTPIAFWVISSILNFSDTIFNYQISE
ncbi:MAG: rod shape-determining protein MreD [Candidatus Hydrogenedentes bacterium]|nr:rod shape-determining protein MreD [Candidatus Hydrogenedentota bacterium]